MAYQPNNGQRLVAGPAWVDYSTVRTFPALEQKSSWFEQNILDPMRSFGSGSNSLLSGAGWLAEQMGAEDFGGAIQEFAQHGVDYWQSSLTPETQDALKKDLFDVTDQGVDFNFTKLVNGVASSAPSFVVGLGAGGVLAKGLQLFANPLGRTALVEAINAGKAAGPGSAAWATAESAAKSLQFVDNLIGIGGYGASEGAMAGAAVGAEVSNTIKAMDHKTLSEKSERYRTLYDSYAGETEERRQQLAKGALADEASTDAGWKSGLATAVLGAPAGAFFGRILGPSSTRLWAEAEKFAVMRGSRTGAAIEGLVKEGGSEALQSASEQMFTNLGIQQADETQDTFEGVGEAAIEGGLIGGILGGGVGAVAGNEHTQQARIDSEKETDQRNTDRLIATSLEAIKGHGLDDYAARILEAQPERGRLQTLSDLAYMAENGAVRDETLEELFPDLGADAEQDDAEAPAALDVSTESPETNTSEATGQESLQVAPTIVPTSVERSASLDAKTSFDALERSLQKESDAYADATETEFLNNRKQTRDPLKDAIQDAVNAPVLDPDNASTIVDVALSNGRTDLAEYAVSRAERAVAKMDTTPGVAPESSKYSAIKSNLDARKAAATQQVQKLRDKVDGYRASGAGTGAATAQSGTRFSLRDSDGVASLNGVAEVGEPIGNSVLADAKLFGDGPEALAAVSEGFQGVDRDTQGVVLSRVISALDDKEVVRAVIESVPIDVMNSLIGEKGSADLLRGNKTVLASRLSIPGNKPVPVSVVRVVDALASSLKQGLATGGAKESGLAGAPTLSGEGGSAVGAGKDGWHGAVAGREVKVNPTPTPKQIEAGNWQKGHVRLKGLEISVENLLGSTRSLAKRAGSIQMQDHYGYIRGFTGADNEKLDVYVKDTDDASIEAAPIFAVEQLTPDGKFDEDKVYMGYDSDKEVRASFLAHQQLKPAMRMGPRIRKFDDVAAFRRWAKMRESQHQKLATAAKKAAAKTLKGAASADQIDVAKLPAGKSASIRIVGLEVAKNIAKARKFKKGRDLKLAMQDEGRAARAASGVDLREQTQAAHNILAQALVADAVEAMKTNSNAIGWYDDKVSKALSVLALTHPEIATDKASRVAFIWALAVTSNGQKVAKNFELAQTAYAAWKATGKMPTDIGIGNPKEAINNGMELFNALSGRLQPAELERFLATKFTVGEIEAAIGVKPGGEWTGTVVRGAAIAGPKVGNGFLANLMGFFDALTMDRWFMRTWGRITGDLVEVNKKEIAKKSDALAALVAKLSPKDSAALAGMIKGGIDAAPQALAEAIDKASQDTGLRETMQRSAKLNAVRLAARALNIAADGSKEAPSGPGQRAWIRTVMGTALRELQTEYPNLTMADLQALLWYPEKKLYDSAKEDGEEDSDSYSDDEAPDYANASVAIARAAGFKEADIQAALSSAGSVASKQVKPFDAAEKAAFLRRTKAPPEQTQTIVFEVAPDPKNVELTEQWNALSAAVKKAITRDVGDWVTSELARALKLKVLAPVTASGGFGGQINPNQIAAFAEKNLSYDQAQMFAAAVGKVLDQASMVLVDSRSPEVNGVIRITTDGNEASKNADEIWSIISKAIPEIAGDGFTARGKTMDVLNLTKYSSNEISDVALHDKIIEALTNSRFSSVSGVSYGKVRSALIERENYDGKIDGVRLRDRARVQREIARITADARARIDAGIRDAGGPGLAGAARLADGEADGQAAPDVRFRLREEGSTGSAPAARGAEARQDGQVAPPKFTSQKIQKDAVSAVGIHYGKAGLKALDPTMAGTGAAGGERRRLGMGRLGLTNPRVNFYIREPGQAVPPSEAVVGGAESYQVELMNLYDYDADPRGFFAKYPNNVDMVEEEVTDAGFDGILFPKHPQIPVRTAIVFGFKRKIPVVPVPAGEPVMDLRYALTEGDRKTSAQKPKSPEVKTGLTAKAVQGLVNTLNWAGKDKIRVFDTVADLPLYLQQSIESGAIMAQLRDAGLKTVEEAAAKGVKLDPHAYDKRAQGFYDPASKSAVVIAGNIDSPEQAYRTIVEEHLRHEGMRRFFTPAKLDQFLDGIYSALPQEGLRAVAKTYSANLDKPEGRRLAAEEYIAKMRLDQERSPLMARVGDWVRGQLRSMGFKMSYSNRDVIHILQQIEDGVRSGRIASPAWNGVGDDPVAPMYSLSGETDRWYYSAMLRSVETGTGAPKKAGATQWKQWLDGAQRRGEFKQAEREWIGVDEFLDSRGDTTRAELVEFVNSNQVMVDETVLGDVPSIPWQPAREDDLPDGISSGSKYTTQGGETFTKFQFAGGWYAEVSSRGGRSRKVVDNAESEEAIDAELMTYVAGELETPSSVKFDSYQLPGGQNYRELLLTMPVKDGAVPVPVKHPVQDGYALQYPNGDYVVSVDGGARHERSQDPSLATQWETERYAGIGVSSVSRTTAAAFESSHFTQPNILAHIRFNERVDSDGKRVLFVEEVQSDWDTAGREMGYVGQKPDDEARIAKLSQKSALSDGETKELARLKKRVAKGTYAVPRKPDADIGLTAMKRMIRWAAENGFDRISWTTGDQQAERYDLSKQISKVSWHERDRRLLAYDSSGTEVMDKGAVTSDNLEDFIGKDAAQKLLDKEPNNAGVRSVVGVELKVGGEGMRGFYDKMLPTEVGKYVKKFGGQVSSSKLDVGKTERRTAAEAREDGGWFGSRGVATPQPSIDITPAMRQAAIAGQPLFRLRDVTSTPEIEGARRFISGPRPAAMSLGDRVRVLMRDIYRTWTKQNALEIEQGLFDSGASLKDWEKRLTGALQDASESAGKMYDLARNPSAVLASVMRTGVPKLIDGAFQPVAGRKGLIDVFRPLYEQAPSGTTLVHLWEDYAAARRSSRLITEQNRDGTSREKQLSQEQIDELLKLETTYPIFRQVFDDWQAFNSQMLDFAVENGVLSAQMRRMWAANDYVPFYRVIEELTDQAAGNSSSSRLTGRQVRSKRLTGGVGVIEPIFESIVKNSAYVLDSVYKNETMKRTVKMLAGHALTRAPMSFQPVRFNAGQIEKAMANAGIAMMSERDVKPGGSYRGQLKNLTQAELDQWNTMFTMVAPAGSNVVSVMIDGKAQYYFVDDPLLLRSIQAIGPQSMSHLMKFMSGGKELLTNLVTTDPGFMAVNFLRDTISAWVTSSAPFKPVLDGFKGALDSWKDDPLRWKLQTAGASLGGYYDTRGADAYAAMELDTGSAPKLGIRANWRRWQRFGAHFENANRMAIARSIIDSGGTVAEAAYQALDIMNFSMHGDSKSIRALTMTVPFMNARLQGLYRLWRGRNAASFWQRGAIIAGATLALMFKNWDDDRYWELEEFERDAYWHFWLGDEHIKIAKPFEVGQLFGTIWERTAATAFGPDTARLLIQRMGSMAFDTFAMNPVPQIVKPIIEQYANKNSFTGRPIENQSLQGLLPEQRYMPWTSESARVFAAALPDWAPAWLRSPVRVEALVRGYMGTLGLYALQASDQIARPLGGFGEPPAMALKDMPVVRRFYGGDTATRTKYEEPIYKLLDIANETRKSVMELRRRGDAEGANEIAQSNADILAARGRLNAFSTQMRALNMQERAVWNSSFTAEEKKVKIDALRARRNDMLRQSAELLEKLDPYLPYL